MGAPKFPVRCGFVAGLCVCSPNSGVVPRASGVSSTPRLLGSIMDVSGILDHPLSRMMTTWSQQYSLNSPRLRDLAAPIARVLPCYLIAIDARRNLSKRLLLVAALLAGEFHPRRAAFSRDAIWRAAFAANRLDAGIALLHDDGLARHGFADQALGLFAHRLLRHSLRTCRGQGGSLIARGTRDASSRVRISREWMSACKRNACVTELHVSTMT